MPVSGGPSGKAGLMYETNWTIYCLIEMLEGRYDSIYLEPLPPLGDKVEFILKFKDKVEFHQVKRQKYNLRWTANDLKEELIAFYKKINGKEKVCCKFISTTSATELKELQYRSLKYDYNTFIKTLSESKEYKKEFENVCSILKVDGKNTYSFFKQIRFIPYDEEEMRKINKRFLNRDFKDDSEIIHSCLFEYTFKNTEKCLTKENIMELLNVKFETKPLKAKKLNCDQFKNSNRVFKRKVEYSFSKLVKREELVDKIINKLSMGENIIIKSDGGNGKTIFIYQILEKIKNDYKYIVLDIEKLGKFSSINELNEKLGVDENLSHILHRLKNPLLIIDQLDYISIVNGGNINNIIVLDDLIQDLKLFKIPFLITCRSHDLNRDDKLNKFIKLNKIKEIILNKFTEKEINQFLENEGINHDFSEEQIEILKIPLNLKLLSDTKNYNFDGYDGLFNNYWEHVKDKITNQHSENEWNSMLDKIFEYMENNYMDSVPKDKLENYSHILDKMISKGIFIEYDNKYQFFHRNILNFFYARHFTANQDLYEFLKERDQLLYDRSFTRSVLNYEKESDYSEYIKDSINLLNSKDIRNHIKISILDVLLDAHLIKDEWKIIKEYVEDNNHDFHEYVWKHIVDSVVWFEYLNSEKLINKYLKKNSILKDKTLWMLKRLRDKIEEPSQIIYNNYISNQNKWKLRSINHIYYDNLKTESSFKLFLKLINDNVLFEQSENIQKYYDDFINPLSYAKIEPKKFIDVYYEFIKNVLDNSKIHDKSWITELSHINIVNDYFEKMSEYCPEYFIDKMLPLIKEISEFIIAINVVGNYHDWYWNDSIYNQTLDIKSLTIIIIETLKKSLLNLYQNNKESFVNIITILKECKFDTFHKILYEIFNQNPQDCDFYGIDLKYLKHSIPKKSENQVYFYPHTPIITLEDAEKLSDKQWLSLIQKHNHKPEDTSEPDYYDLSQTLEKCIKKEPKRFSILINKFDNDFHSAYYDAVLSGINGSNLDFKEIINVCRKCHGLKNKPCGKRIVELLSNYINDLNEESINMIKYYLTEDPNPESDIWDSIFFRNGAKTVGNINSVRGASIFNLAKIINKNGKIISKFKFKSTLEKLVNDNIISIRAIVAYLLIFVMEYNTELSFKLFNKLISHKDKILLGKSEFVLYYIFYNIRDNINSLDKFFNLINDMIKSKEPLLNENAGRIITLDAIMHEKMTPKLDHCISLSTHHKKGVIMELVDCFDYSSNKLIKELISKLLHDENENIIKEVANCFNKINEENFLEYKDLILNNMNENIVVCNSICNSIFLHKLLQFGRDKTRDEAILKICGYFIDKNNENIVNAPKREYGSIICINNLVLKIYGNSLSKKLQIMSLDLIDKLVLDSNSIYDINEGINKTIDS
jgi:hypothetical protein